MRVGPGHHRRLVVVAFALSLVAGATAGAVDSALIDAAKRQDADTIRRLLDEGADANERQPDGATALHWAAHRGHGEAVEMLLASGADVNAVNRLGASPLFLAAKNGDAATIERLLAAGADPGTALPEGETPVMTAARSGTARGVRMLIAAGANVNVREQSRGQTALMWATSQGHHDVMRALVDAGADPEARSKVRPRLVYAAASNGAVFEQGLVENLGGYTPLLFAARQGDVEAARLLLEAGADIDTPAGNGASPLVVAVHSGHPRLAGFLLETGVDPDSIGAGYNPLHAAVLRGDLETLEALLANGADPDVRLRRPTPIQRASEDWSLKSSMVSATPYWLAAYFRESEIMRALADGGADPDLTTTELWLPVKERADGIGPPQVVGGFVTPLQAAVRGASDRGRFYVIANEDPVGEELLALEAVKVAASHGNDVGWGDFTGSAALHDAASRNLVSIVRFLAEQGADVNAEDGRGRTPMDAAVASSRRRRVIASLGPNWTGETVIDVLKEFGAAETGE